MAVVGQPSSSEATIEGQVLPGAQHAKCELEYGSTETYGIRVPCNDLSIISADSGATASVHLTGLEPGAAYDYRLIVENASGPSAPGEGKSTFTTTTTTPLLSAEIASEVGSSGALLSGAIAPEGARTRYWFEYGSTEALGQSTPGGEVPAGTGVVQLTPEAISGLTPGTLYHYRLRAENQWHEAFGETQTFTTASGSPTTPSGGPPTTSPGGSELGVSLTPPMSQPLPSTPSAPTTPTAPKKTTKKVAKCKHGEKRERGRCLKKKEKRRPAEKRLSPTSSRRITGS